MMAKIDLESAYAEHAREVYHFLLRLCGNANLAEDLLQDTFLKAMEASESFDYRCKLTSWLCQIAKNTYYDHLRKTKRHPLSELPEDVADTRKDVMERLEDAESAREIRLAVHRLSEPYKEVFLLRVYAQLPYKEIGMMFGKSEVWGRVTFMRSKDMVMRMLEDGSCNDRKES